MNESSATTSCIWTRVELLNSIIHSFIHQCKIAGRHEIHSFFTLNIEEVKRSELCHADCSKLNIRASLERMLQKANVLNYTQIFSSQALSGPMHVCPLEGFVEMMTCCIPFNIIYPYLTSDVLSYGM